MFSLTKPEVRALASFTSNPLCACPLPYADRVHFLPEKGRVVAVNGEALAILTCLDWVDTTAAPFSVLSKRLVKACRGKDLCVRGDTDQVEPLAALPPYLEVLAQAKTCPSGAEGAISFGLSTRYLESLALVVKSLTSFPGLRLVVKGELDAVYAEATDPPRGRHWEILAMPRRM